MFGTFEGDLVGLDVDKIKEMTRECLLKQLCNYDVLAKCPACKEVAIFKLYESGDSTTLHKWFPDDLWSNHYEKWECQNCGVFVHIETEEEFQSWLRGEW